MTGDVVVIRSRSSSDRDQLKVNLSIIEEIYNTGPVNKYQNYEKFLNPDRVRETILCNNNHSSILADKHLIRIIMDYALQHWD